MGPVADLRGRAPTAILDNAEPALQEKLPISDSPGETQYSFFSAQLEAVAQAPSIPQLKSTCPTFEALMETGLHGGLWWLHITSPSDEDVDTLSRMLDIHPLTTEDIKTRELREKIELFGPYYFVSLLAPQQAEFAKGVRAAPANFYGIVFPGSIVSFTYDNNRHPAHVWSRIKEHQNHLHVTSDWICYALIDDIVDGFGPVIDRVQIGVEMMEDGVSVTQPDDIGLALRSIYNSRKEVTRIRGLLHDKTDVVQCFARHCGSLGSSPAEVELYLSDIQDHVLTMMSNLANAEQMLSRSQSKYVGQLSFQSTRMRNQITAAVSRLTVIGSIFVTMQATLGLFSMNVTIPGENVASLTWWFGILGFIIGVPLLSLTIARRTRII